MIRALLWFVQALFVVPALYSAGIAVWGLRSQRAIRGDGTTTRVRVVVPAHDESPVIGGIAADLAAQAHPSAFLTVHVLADRCTDDTVDIAAVHVPVVERSTGTGGKGAALAWYLRSYPLDGDEVLVVLDADNRVDPGYVTAVADAVSAGHPVVQTYLDVANPDGSALATANALTYWASNRMVQLARTNLGWSCDLGGTGMAISAEALADGGGFTDDLTDDLALNIRLNLAGHRAFWLHGVHVRDEKPTGTTGTVMQRARWVRGKRDVQRRYGRRLVAEGLRRRSMGLVDLAIRLFDPGRSFVALVIGVLAVVAGVWPTLGLWPWWVLGGIALGVVVYPVVFLALDGVPARYLARYPYVTLLALLWIPIRVASRLIPGWRRTAHSGS